MPTTLITGTDVTEAPDRVAAPKRRAFPAAGGRISRFGVACLALLLTLAAPAATFAAEGDESTDARLEGYAQQVAMEKSGAGTTYLILVLLIIVVCAVMFKNAKRSHLD